MIRVPTIFCKEPYTEPTHDFPEKELQLRYEAYQPNLANKTNST